MPDGRHTDEFYPLIASRPKPLALPPGRLVGRVALVLLIIGLAPVVWAPPRFVRPAIDDPLGQQKSPVYDVYSEYAVHGSKINIPTLRYMLNTGITRLAGTRDLARAWRCFIHDNDVVALKFTAAGSNELATNRALTVALLSCLYEAGFKPQNLMVVGLSDLPDEAQGTRPCRYGWDSRPVDFHSGCDFLPAWLHEVTAIINIPSILDDNITGLRGALTNLSLDMIKGPARWYCNGADPFIAEIYELPAIRGKVRLHLANALCILYQGGPIVEQTYIWDYGSLMFSDDPVALDRGALELLRRARRTLPMPTNVEENIKAGYLDTAYYLGLGYNDLNFIDYQRVRYERP